MLSRLVVDRDIGLLTDEEVLCIQVDVPIEVVVQTVSGENNPPCRNDVTNGAGFGGSKSDDRVPAAICARIDRTKALLVLDQIYKCKRFNQVEKM